MFSLEQLQSFIVVAEELHFGRAAERLAVTQPSLSRRIQRLEGDLGVEVFVRSHRSVTLTPAGSAFLSDARRILRLSAEATTSVRRVPSGQVGTISIGFTAATAYSYLGQLLDVAAARLPEVEIVLREMVSDLQVDALHDATIDLGLIRPPVRSTDVSSVRVVTEPMLAAVPAAHPAATAGRLAAGDLHGRPFVMYWASGSRYFHDLLLAAFAHARIEPDFRQFVTQVHTALALVRAGVGLALVPAAAQSLRFDGVVLVPVSGFDGLHAELELIWRPVDLNPARDALVAALRPAQRRTAGRGSGRPAGNTRPARVG
jgi:DNA-binding transcriptional LysR family regulator